MKFAELLSETTKHLPDRLAVQFRRRRLLYRELSAALDALAAKLGPVAGRRIVLLLPDGLPSYLCHLHFFLEGSIVVPLTVQASTAQVKTVCDKVEPQLVVTNALLRSRHLDVLQHVTCLVIESDGADAQRGFACKVTYHPDPRGEPRLGSDNVPDDLRLIVFTSGSTGEPKGVCLGEDTILAAAGMNVSLLGLDSTRRSLVTVPLYDYYGFIQIYSHILAQSGYIFGESIAFPDQLFRTIRDYDATDLVLVPYTLREILRIASSEHLAILRQLRFMTSSSDVLTAKLLNHVFQVHPNLTIFNIYGLTEAGRACYRQIEATSPRSSSIGRPSPGVEILIDDSSGDPGEIVIRGPNVMRGYFQGVRNNRVVLRPCSEMRTGDLGYFDEHREIILLGRRDHVLNLNGAKIHPSEIERVALQAPGVADARARVARDSTGENVIRLDLVAANGQCDLDEVQAHLRRNLLPRFVPQQLNIVSTLQRTELGSKIIR